MTLARGHGQAFLGMFVTWKVYSSSFLFFSQKYSEGTHWSVRNQRLEHEAPGTRESQQVATHKHTTCSTKKAQAQAHTHQAHTQRQQRFKAHHNRGQRSVGQHAPDMRPQLSWSVTTGQLDSVTPLSSATSLSSPSAFSTGGGDCGGASHEVEWCNSEDGTTSSSILSDPPPPQIRA